MPINIRSLHPLRVQAMHIGLCTSPAVHVSRSTPNNIARLPFPLPLPFPSRKRNPMDPLITADEQLDDSSSIIEYLRDTSRAYRNQAIALIGICRFFSQFSTQGRGQSQDTELTR